MAAGRRRLRALRDALRPPATTVKGLLFLVVLAVTTGAWMAWDAARTLHDASFRSGWLLLVVLVAFAVVWWRRTGRGRDQVGAHFHPILVVGLVLSFGMHVGLELPRGWVERSLFVLFLALVLALVRGRSHDAGSQDPRSRWGFGQLILGSLLLTMSLFHGVFVHAHGLLAHLFLSK